MADLELQKAQLSLRSLIARGDAALGGELAALQVQVEALLVAVALLTARLEALEKRPSVVLHHHHGGAAGITNVAPFDLGSLPVGDPTSTPEEILLRQAGTWRRLAWGQFLDLIGTTTPADDNYASSYSSDYSAPNA